MLCLIPFKISIDLPHLQTEKLPVYDSTDFFKLQNLQRN